MVTGPVVLEGKLPPDGRGGGWRLLGMGITRKLQSAQHSAVWTIRAVVVMTEESGALPGGSG